MSESDNLIPLSGLQHVLYCERQAALIHVEKCWRENAYTVEGRHLHSRVDETAPRRERRGDMVILRGLPLRSDGLGIIGRADVVELHRASSPSEIPAGPDMQEAVRIKGLSGFWKPYPVEYKRGRPKKHRADEVQLCAQAICLEEMLNVEITEGALFYGRTKRRTTVCIDADLRRLVEHAAAKLKSLIRTGFTPKADYSEKCEKCSLIDICLPVRKEFGKSGRYLSEMLEFGLNKEME